MGTLTFILGWVQAFFFGWIIPWWAWPTLGFILGTVAYFGLPAGVPGTLRQLVASVLVCIGLGLGMFSWGQATGIALTEEAWQRKMAAEQERLTNGFLKQIGEEKLRAQMAENNMGTMRDTLEEITRDADALQDDGGIVIPEHIAKRLYDLRADFAARHRR